jgi:hypothetical protein
MPTLAPTGFAPSTAAAMGYGYREDLSEDAVTDLDPADSYFTKKCSRKTVALRHDWMADNLPQQAGLPNDTPSSPVAVASLSTNWTFSTTIARKRLFNQTEYIYVPWSIAQAAERSAELGFIAGDINSEIAEEVERQMRNIGKFIERILLSAQAERVDNDSGVGTAGLCSGFFDVTNWNQYSGAASPLAWNAIACANLAAFNALSQNDIETLLLSAYNNGGMGPYSAYMPTDFHAAISESWIGRPGYQVYSEEKDHAIDNQIFTYYSRSGIGQVDFISDRTLNGEGCIAFVNHSYAKIGEFIPLRVYERPYINRNHEGVIETQFTFIDRNPQAHARVYTLGNVTPAV